MRVYIAGFVHKFFNALQSVDDGHDVTGLLVRDYLRAGCVGLPDL